jgi:hypothetical protein
VAGHSSRDGAVGQWVLAALFALAGLAAAWRAWRLFAAAGPGARTAVWVLAAVGFISLTWRTARAAQRAGGGGAGAGPPA